MTEPDEPRILANTGGLIVTDDGRRILVIDRGTGTPAVVAFVLGVITVVVGGFGIVALFSISTALGAAFVTAGVAVAIATAVAVRAFWRRRTQPLHACRSVAVVDRKLGLFSCAGGAVAPLQQVSFHRRMQVGSSSPMLVAVMPGGTAVLKRGNPFDGGIGNVDQILTAAVGIATHR